MKKGKQFFREIRETQNIREQHCPTCMSTHLAELTKAFRVINRLYDGVRHSIKGCLQGKRPLSSSPHKPFKEGIKCLKQHSQGWAILLELTGDYKQFSCFSAVGL